MTTLPSMSTHQLLMIEDDDRLAQMVGDYLGQNGLQVTHMADGKSGLEQLQPADGGSAGELPDHADPARLASRLQAAIFGLRAYAQRSDAGDRIAGLAEDIAQDIEALRRR